MNSFHPSRGRVYFEIFCALTIGASCAVAWLQTGASALLAIAGVAAVYSLVHATDVGRKITAITEAAPDPAPVIDEKGGRFAFAAEGDTAPAAAAAVKPPKAPKAKRRSRKKEDLPPETFADLVVVEPPEAVTVDEALDIPAELPEAAVENQPAEAEEDYHPPVAPLFEPQPLLRQQRAVFGRKAG